MATKAQEIHGIAVSTIKGKAVVDPKLPFLVTKRIECIFEETATVFGAKSWEIIFEPKNSSGRTLVSINTEFGEHFYVEVFDFGFSPFLVMIYLRRDGFIALEKKNAFELTVLSGS